jgi:hypothetical protein
MNINGVNHRYSGLKIDDVSNMVLSISIDHMTTAPNTQQKQSILVSFEKCSLARKESLEASTTTYEATPPHHYPDIGRHTYSCKYIYIMEIP